MISVVKQSHAFLELNVQKRGKSPKLSNFYDRAFLKKTKKIVDTAIGRMIESLTRQKKRTDTIAL